METHRSINQLVHTLSYGDAISGEVFALQRCFRGLGWNSEIYAINIHPNYKGLALDYQDLPERSDADILLHYSLGSPLNDLYLKKSRSKRILIYHNLTPAEWFAGVNPRIVSDIEKGRKELPILCSASDLLLADSQYNSTELRKLGFSASVLELPLDPQKWEIETNPGIYSLVRQEPAIHLLHVGRLAPNKCIEDIIRIFYFLHHYISKQSRLWLVGIDIDTELYSFALKRLVLDLKLEQAVNFTGCLADSELKALYQSASVYLCMSEHEGFCLPLVEAMFFGLPVIAFASSAVPDTIGNGGLLVTEKKHADLAELVALIHSDLELRQQLICSGKERVRELSFEKFEQRVLAVFN